MSVQSPETVDPFAGSFLGAFVNPVAVDSSTKERSYSANSHYSIAKTRPNLHVSCGSHVHKILFNNERIPIATGVSYIRNGKKHSAFAKKDVILAAGAVQSPQLLELSGIGSPQILNPIGIPVKVENSRVGENLQDHVLVAISYEVQDGVPSLDDLLRQDPDALQAAMKDYQMGNPSPLGSGGVTSFGFLPFAEVLLSNDEASPQEHISKVKPSTDTQISIPESQVTVLRQYLTTSNVSSGTFFTFQGQVAKGSDLKPGNYLTIVTGLAHPFSRGNVHIDSSKSEDKPIIKTNYLYHPLDLDIMSQNVQYLERISKTEPLASYSKPDGQRNAPGAYATRDRDSEKIKDYIRSSASSNWHLVGTCAMMPRDQGGVVDDRLMVYGTKNLRVVDASIIPLIPQCNTMSVVYMVAEHAAYLVKKQYSLL
jgi:choline dehydrogenase-like flavoprotein